MRLRVPLAVALLALLAALASGAVLLRRSDAPAKPAAAAVSYVGSQVPAGIQVPDVSLRDADGALVRTGALRGKALAITFLDTACTDSCPVIATQLAHGLARLTPAERQRVEVLAVSVDPPADTPAHARRFLRRNGALGKVRFLVGSTRELRPVWRRFGVVSALASGDADTHSDPVRIYDPRGEWVTTLAPGIDLSPASLAHDLRSALRQAA